jgi:hypothetical protein
MYVFLGWFTIALLLVMTAPFWLRFLNKHVLHLKGGAYGKTIKTLRTIHKPLGVAIAVVALVHGYLALGALRLHTGSLLWLAVLVTAVLGVLFYYFKKKPLFAWHKRMVLVVLFLLLVHLIFPSAVYYLLP